MNTLSVVLDEPPQPETVIETVHPQLISAVATVDHPVAMVALTAGPADRIEDLGIGIRQPLEKLEIGLDLDQPIPLKPLPPSKLNLTRLLLLDGDRNKLQRQLIIDGATHDELLNLMAEVHNRTYFHMNDGGHLSRAQRSFLQQIVRKVRHVLEETKAVTC